MTRSVIPCVAEATGATPCGGTPDPDLSETVGSESKHPVNK